MPLRESVPVTVTLIVEVDGHRLTFEETGRASGARYHGAATTREYLNEVLEQNVRGTVDTCAARVQKRAEQLVARMYPVAADPGGGRG